MMSISIGSLPPAVLYVLILSLLAACGAGRSLHLVPSLPELRVDAGDSAVLQCVLVGNSMHGGFFSWGGPAVENNEEGHTTTTLSDSGTVSTLTIHSVGRGDAGEYTCSYTGLHSISIMLTVVVDPHFEDVSEHQEFIEGIDAVVECPVFLGDPPGSMIWSRDSMTITGERFIAENGRLTIRDIRVEDEDVYQCSIDRHGIHGPRHITVVVRERSELAPSIVEPVGTIDVMYGAPLDLMCELEEPRDNVHYTWTIDTDFENNQLRNTTPTLHRDPYEFLGGRYTCTAENGYGPDSQVYFVRVLAPPLPATCSESLERRDEGATLVLGYCELTSPVQQSELEFQWSKRGENGELIEIVPEGRFRVNHEGLLTIENVQPSDSGVYRVIISNDQGSAMHTVRLEVDSRPTTTPPPSVPISLTFEVIGGGANCEDIEERVFTEALKMKICEECDGVVVDARITCQPNSKIGTYDATITAPNAQQLAKRAQLLDEIVSQSFHVSFDPIEESMPQTRTSDRVAGIVAPVLIIVTVVIVAAALSILGLICYKKKRTTRVTDTDPERASESTTPPSTEYPHIPTNMTTLQINQGNHFIQPPSPPADSNRRVRPNELSFLGQNGSAAIKKPLYGRSISFEPPSGRHAFRQ